MHMQDSVAQMHNPEQPMPSTVENMPASLEMEMEMEMEMEVERELEVELEMEGKGKWKNNKHPHTRAVPDPVMSVFEHWRRVMDHPKAVSGQTATAIHSAGAGRRLQRGGFVPGNHRLQPHPAQLRPK